LRYVHKSQKTYSVNLSNHPCFSPSRRSERLATRGNRKTYLVCKSHTRTVFVTSATDNQHARLAPSTGHATSLCALFTRPEAFRCAPSASTTRMDRGKRSSSPCKSSTCAPGGARLYCASGAGPSATSGMPVTPMAVALLLADEGWRWEGSSRCCGVISIEKAYRKKHTRVTVTRHKTYSLRPPHMVFFCAE
jgi:hypothetical protein